MLEKQQEARVAGANERSGSGGGEGREGRRGQVIEGLVGCREDFYPSEEGM